MATFRLQNWKNSSAYLARSERSHKVRRLWDFRTTTRGNERSEVIILNIVAFSIFRFEILPFRFKNYFLNRLSKNSSFTMNFFILPQPDLNEKGRRGNCMFPRGGNIKTEGF